MVEKNKPRQLEIKMPPRDFLKRYKLTGLKGTGSAHESPERSRSGSLGKRIRPQLEMDGIGPRAPASFGVPHNAALHRRP